VKVGVQRNEFSVKVVIETTEEGVAWKLQTLPDGETLTSSIIYHPSMEECLKDLCRHAHSWEKYLPGRTVERIGEVQVVTDGANGQTLSDIWPDLERPQ
jgi:hypothetical protein